MFNRVITEAIRPETERMRFAPSILLAQLLSRVHFLEDRITAVRLGPMAYRRHYGGESCPSESVAEPGTVRDMHKLGGGCRATRAYSPADEGDSGPKED
ncbi:hypothetical protein BN946_scf184798.g84 [Trametes cinnabarina]|uniref:Uncharacterized protein n=1 Tax=Pycnoporus cinnabarinus TaxID=5643 RepID=A0A060SES3_PYCCI|nr:hypothetical protein BN946_scf184798.g84 [Trametes cinnabarina]